MYRFGIGPRSIGANEVPWCENVPPNQCIKASQYSAVMAKAKADCAAYKKLRNQARGLLGVRGLGVMCSSYAYRADVMLTNLDQYDPCYVETLPPCMVTDPPTTPVVPPTLPPAVRMEDPPQDEQDDDDNNMFMVGGILAAVLVVGGGYAVFKSRKKKKGGKKR